jgi:hypothetical protein
MDTPHENRRSTTAAHDRQDEHGAPNMDAPFRQTTRSRQTSAARETDEAFDAEGSRPLEAKTQKVKKQRSPHQLPDYDKGRRSPKKTGIRKLTELIELVHFPDGLDDDERNARIQLVLDMYESVAPEDAVEGMLAKQMVGTYHAALECLRRAAAEDVETEERDVNLKHAYKLMSLYVQQIAALDKHRGKGQQKVTVEHVNVAAGGRAFVGNVEATSGQDVASGTRPAQDEQEAGEPGPKALEHKPAAPMPEIRPRKRTRPEND